MKLLARDAKTVTLRMSRDDEFSLIMRGLSWLHQNWDDEAFIVTDFTRDDYRAFLDEMLRICDVEPGES